MIRNIILIFLAVLIYKAILNSIRYFQMKRFLIDYDSWLKKPGDDFITHRTQIINLLKGANISDPHIPVVQPRGHGQLVSFNASAFLNFPSLDPEQSFVMVMCFNDAIGVYRERVKESFSLFYWVNLVIFLPKNILIYLGVKPENISVKILQVLWWLMAPIGTAAFALYKKEILLFIKGLIERMLK